MEDISQENSELRSKCDKFERSNQSLMAQLTKLQNMIKKIAPQQSASQTGICLMVMVLCFAVFFGDWIPFSFGSGSGLGSPSLSPHDSVHLNAFDSYSDAMKPSRTLFTMADEERSCGNEPWPVTIARKSFECISNLITPSNTVNESAPWSNNSDMPFVVTTHESSVGA